MENVILIKVESFEQLTPAQNFLILDLTTNELYRGDDGNAPIKISDEKNSNFATHFLLMGA